MTTLVVRATRAIARVGDGWDAIASAAVSTPRTLRQALAGPRQRRIAVIAATGVLAFYLLAIGDIAISTSGGYSPGLRFAPEMLFQARTPYLFEPVVVLFAGAHVAAFLSPVNLFLGGVVAVLAAANITLAAYGARQAVACRRPGYSRTLAVLPAFLLGFTCCVPTFALALGAGTAAAILPVLLPLRALFYPATLLLLLAGVVWGAHRVRSNAADSRATHGEQHKASPAHASRRIHTLRRVDRAARSDRTFGRLRTETRGCSCDRAR